MAASPAEGPAPSAAAVSRPPVKERGLIALSTRRPVALSMIVLTVLIFGAISFQRLPQNLMPDISYPTITVRAEYPGASPIDVERRVSRRLEEVLSQVRKLRRVSSVSRAERSDVILEFAWQTDMSLATMDVREKVDQAILPDGVQRPTILRYDPTLDPILQVGLYKKAGSRATDPAELIELRLAAEDLIERELETVDGVAAVQVRGGLEREILIHISEAQLKSRGLSTALINQRLREENLNQASGQLYEGDQAYVVRTVNEFRNIEEIGEIIVKREGTVPIRLKEVAQVSWGHAEPEVLSRINGNPCVKIDIYKEADANIVDVARRAQERLFGTPAERRRLKEIEAKKKESEAGPQVAKGKEPPRTSQKKGEAAKGKPGFLEMLEEGVKGGGGAVPGFLAAKLPAGMALEVMSDQSVFIQKSLDDVYQTAISGGILSALIIYLFLRNFWFTVVVNLSVPISVVATFVVMYVLGVSLNLMSLGGLALGIGMLVDNSIVVLESIFRCREEGDGARAAAVRGTQEVAGAVVASTLTAVAVFFPIVFVEGVAGQVFGDQALTVVISLLASLLVALYLIPACVARSGGGPAGGEGAAAAAAPGFESLRTFKRRFAGLRWRWFSAPALGVWTVLLAAAAATSLLFELLGRLLSAGLAWSLIGLRSLKTLLGSAAGGPSARFLDLWEAGYRRLLDLYERALRASLAHKGAVIAIALVSFLGSLGIYRRLGSELIPEVHQGEFTVDVRLPVGTRIEKTEAVLRPLETIWLAEAGALGIDSVTGTVGMEKDSIQAGDEGEHTAKLLVRLKPGENLLQAEERVKARLREVLATEPELKSVKFQNPVLFSFKTPIEVEVKGYNLQDLKRTTRAVEELFRSNPALKDVKSNIAPGYPELNLEFDRDLLARYNLTVASVGNVIREKVQGDVPTYFNEGDRKVGLRVRLLEEDRESLEDLRALVVNPGLEPKVTLSEVAKLDPAEGPAEIRRISQQRAGVVSANLSGIDLGRVTREIEAGLERVPRPVDFLVGFGGQKEEMDQSLRSLTRALLLAIFLVYVVMAVQFESLLQPLIIVLAVPLAMVGVGPALWALGIPLSIVVFLGMIILAGIVVNNAIVLLDCVNQLRARGASMEEALVQAGKIRLRPILMTTITTIVGLLPLTGWFAGVDLLQFIFGSGEGAEIRGPLAITVMAGLSASTVLTLVVVPVIYSIVVREPAESWPEQGHA